MNPFAEGSADNHVKILSITLTPGAETGIFEYSGPLKNYHCWWCPSSVAMTPLIWYRQELQMINVKIWQQTPLASWLTLCISTRKCVIISIWLTVNNYFFVTNEAIECVFYEWLRDVWKSLANHPRVNRTPYQICYFILHTLLDALNRKNA